MLDVTPFKQSDESLCGPAVCKMILDYYGIKETESNLATLCGHTFEEGCTNEDMERVLKLFGLQVESKCFGTFEDIKYWLDKGVPVMVDWFSSGVNFGLLDSPNGHASIIIGLGTSYVYIMDPECGGIRQMRREDFMRCWFDWTTPTITSWEDMKIRYMMVAYKQTTI